MRWVRLFEAFRRLGLKRLVVQWTEYDGVVFHAGAGPAPQPPPLDILLRLADHSGMKVLVGLAHDSAYWRESERAPQRLPALFDRLLARSAATAQALRPLVAAHPAFAGWYITEEVDDLSWTPAARPLLFAYLARLSEALKRLMPEADIALSGFTDSRAAPAAVEAFWRELLAAAPAIGCVLFQDGVGVGKLALEQVPDYLAAAARAARAEERKLAAVVETFRQTAGEPLSDGPFAAEPAPLARVLAQIEAAAPHAAELVAFSVPEYMSPAGGPTAGELYRAYLAHLRN